MESIHQFSHLWNMRELISRPEQAIEEIRVKSLQLFLLEHQDEIVHDLNLRRKILHSSSWAYR